MIFNNLKTAGPTYIYNRLVTVSWMLRNYAVSGYYGNELSSVNVLHERHLHARTRTREQSSLSLYRTCSLYIDNILIWMYEI
jgi:hypothetical protein